MINKKSILIFYDPPNEEGGSDVFLSDIFNFFDQKKNDVRILIPEKRRKLNLNQKTFKISSIKSLNNPNFKGVLKVLNYLMRSGIFFINALIFKKYLYRQDLDLVIVVNGGYPGSFLSLSMNLASFLNRKPNILFVLSTPAFRRIYHPNEYFIDYILSKSINKVYLNSNFQLNKLTSRRGFNKTKTEVLYNGILPPKSSKKKIKGKLNFTLGYIGRIDKKKGLFLILDIIKKFESKIELLIAGDGPDYEELNKIITLKKITNIKLLGRVKEKTNFFKKIDVLIFPSLWEGLPYTIIEAMAHHTPIISSDVGGISEIIKHKINGYIIDIKKTKQIENAFHFLVQNPGEFENYACEARKVFEEKLTLQIMKQNFNKNLSKNF